MATVERERWRYVVLLSKFIHQFFQEGFLKSFGVLIPSMVIQLDCSYAVAGFLSSLFFTSTFVFCPLARVLSAKFGCRNISIVGGCMVGVCVSCLFVLRKPAVVGLLLLFAGLGNSFLAQTGYDILQGYFGDQYGAANAAASFGFSFGSFITPLLSYKLLNIYGLWGTFLILGGMMAHCIPIAATYRSPSPASKERTDDTNPSISPINMIKGSGSSELFTGASRSEEARIEESQGANFLTVDRKDCAYQVLSSEAGGDEGETEEKKTQEQKTAYKHTEPMPSSTSLSSCLAISRFFGSVCLLTVRTLALDDLWQEKAFTFLIIPCQMLADMIFAGWCLFVISYGLSVGVDPDAAPFLLVAGEAGSFLSRTLCVVLLRTDQERSLGLHAFFYIALISGLFLYPISSSFGYLIFCSTLTGFGLFGLYTTFYAVLNVSVSGEHFSGILATTFCIFGVMISFSSLLAGRIYDVTQSLKAMFMLYGGLGCVGALLIFTFIYRRKRNVSSMM